MTISPQDEIAGVSLRAVRDALRRTGAEFRRGEFQQALGVADAGWVLDALICQGYLVRRDDSSFELTVKGHALRLASAARPISRATARARLGDLLRRVDEVNTDPLFLYGVSLVLVFGSYLSEAEQLSDLDIVLSLSPKLDPGSDAYRTAWSELLCMAEEQGTRLRSFAEQLAWPHVHVHRHLKQRSRVYSFHDLEEIVGLVESGQDCKYRVAFARSRRIRALCTGGQITANYDALCRLLRQPFSAGDDSLTSEH